jgi:oxygen-independent coproporphyrinogen-3 oxidase
LASLYFHIPFCKQACHYCNFHFSTQLNNKAELVKSMIAELELRKQELPQTPLSSIYFGGGTPSLLNNEELSALFNAIFKHFRIDQNAEVTLEANPDDVTLEKLQFYKQTPINRFSMGVQSFFDEDLIWMNRAHKAGDAERSIKLIQDTGFDKITVDLIYGGPTLTNEHWKVNLEKIVELNLNHLSAYCLTAEPKTALYHHIEVGKQPALDEEKAAQQFEYMLTFLEEHGFEQYEISNFARNNQYAVHNTNYWRNQPYLGIGPSAHSFNGHQRSWNVANNNQYINSLKQGKLAIEIEDLTPENQLNEYLMTGLRTMWGCQWNELEKRFGVEVVNSLQSRIQPYLKKELMTNSPTHFVLTQKGRLLADGIAADLFF